MSTPSRSLNGQLVVLIGGDGYFGTHIAQELLARGARLRVVSRHPEKGFRLKPLGNLGSLQFVRADVTRTEAHAGLVAGANAVVNLAGAFAGDLDALHVRAAGSLASAAAAAGASAFVQVSANGADPESKVAYARTKALGEAAVFAAFPAATILRPSVIFGPDDQFINMFAGLIAQAPVLPVFGPEAKLQPVFVDDAAEAVANALGNPEAFGGKTFELVGPEVMTMFQLNQRIALTSSMRFRFVADDSGDDRRRSEQDEDEGEDPRRRRGDRGDPRPGAACTARRGGAASPAPACWAPARSRAACAA